MLTAILAGDQLSIVRPDTLSCYELYASMHTSTTFLDDLIQAFGYALKTY